jgi:hypothetical protein
MSQVPAPKQHACDNCSRKENIETLKCGHVFCNTCTTKRDFACSKCQSDDWGFSSTNQASTSTTDPFAEFKTNNSNISKWEDF